MQPGGQYGLPEMQEFMLTSGAAAPHHFFSSPAPHDGVIASAATRSHNHFFHHHQQQQQQNHHQQQLQHHHHHHHHSQLQQQHQHQHQHQQQQQQQHAAELLDLYRVHDPAVQSLHHSQAAELQRSTQSFFGLQQQQQHHHHLVQQHMNIKPSLETNVVSHLQLTHQMQSHGGGSDSSTDLASPNMAQARQRSALLSHQAQFKPLQMSTPSTHAGSRDLQISNFPGEAIAAASAHGSGDELYGDLGGELDDRSGGACSRWPREETLTLLRIRSEMDALFRDSGLKAPLWEEVSRRLYLAGFQRNAKKCKEKFENLHKYYKKTKDVKPDRQDGKTYRFRTELEAIYAASQLENELECPDQGGNSAMHVGGGGGGGMDHDAPRLFAPNATAAAGNAVQESGALAVHTLCGLADPNSSSSTSCAAEFQKLHGGEDLEEDGDEEEEEGDEAEEEEEEEEEEGSGAAARVARLSGELDGQGAIILEEAQQGNNAGRKRKRGAGGSHSWRTMRLFFEDLARQLMERQDALHRQFLEAVERRDEERLKREESYKRQEMARLNREQELRAQEQALTRARDAALVSFLQKVTGETLHLPEMAPAPQSQQHQLYHHGGPDIMSGANLMQHMHSAAAAAADMDRSLQAADKLSDLGAFDGNTRRWPKVEVLALIRVRTNLEPRFQEAGPKAQLWEEVSSSMARLGFSRSSKRCKEKWENINKYFRKTKDSTGRKRGADSSSSKTCPYFHQLEELYERGILSSPNSTGKLLNGMKLDGHEEQSEEPLESSKEDSGGGGGGGQMNPSHHDHGSANSSLQQQVKASSCIGGNSATNTQLCMMNGHGGSAEQQGPPAYLDVKPLSDHALINVNNQPSGGSSLHLSLIHSEQEQEQQQQQQQQHLPYQGGGVDGAEGKVNGSGGDRDQGFGMREMMDLQQQKLVDEYERLDQQVQNMVQREQLEAEMSRQMAAAHAAERSYRSDSATLMALVHKLGSSGHPGSDFDLSTSPTTCNES